MAIWLWRCGDGVIDLGPDGGVKGGEIVAVGTPEDVAKAATVGSAGGTSAGKPRSFTGQYLKGLLGVKKGANVKAKLEAEAAE